MADSSLLYGQTIKTELYAETGVPEYWVADIQNDCLVVYTNPANDGYRLLPDLSIPVDVLLP